MAHDGPAFNLLDWTQCLELPRRCRAIAWHEHIPFAFALVSMVRPRVLVELGVHTGDSYLAFCQAVAAGGLSTRCFGVDTWHGDPHAGHYGEEVLQELTAHHQPLYGGFSRLVQATFDEAVLHFTDGSVDLLHIDGLHTYDAVRHDWDTWRSKLSDGSVVLLHDINVRERDFGVWRLWEELSGEHRSFRFDHGHGLGVLLMGDNAPAPLLRLASAPADEQQRVRAFFAALGQRLTLIAQVDALSARLVEYDRALRERAVTEDSLRRDLADHDDALRTRLVEAESVHRQVLEYDFALRSRNAELQHARARINDLEVATTQTQDELERTRDALRSRNAELEQARARIDDQDRTLGLRETDIRTLATRADDSARRAHELEAAITETNDELRRTRDALRAVTSSPTYRLARTMAAPFRKGRRRDA